MAQILLNHVVKRYGKDKLPVVKDFNLKIEDKEFLVMVGPSGCGKSTTLRMIAGLEDISGGEIYIGDQLVNDLPPKDRDIAMVFQNYALYPNMSVYENIAFGLRLRKLPKHEIDLAVKKAARVLEIEQYLERKPRALSGGQRQRVALGRAIVRNPQVFLMDEPLSNLDAKLRVQMRTEIIKLHKTLGVTFVYVTHDQIEAMTMGSRIVIMYDGIIQQADKPEVIYNRPVNTFVASFIGSPPMNFVEGKLLENNQGFLELHTNRFFLQIPKAQGQVLIDKGYMNKTITLGIRPENISVSANQNGEMNGSDIPGVHKISELMGADLYLHMEIGTGSMLCVRTSPRFKVEEDEKLMVTVDMESANFFDRNTGSNIIFSSVQE